MLRYRAMKEHCWFERDLIVHKYVVYKLVRHYAPNHYAMYSARLVIPRN